MATFEELSRIDVTKHIEKKGKFSYLSWPYAVAEFRKNCPKGTWAIIKHNGSPVLKTEEGHFVEVEVTPDMSAPEVKFSQVHPVLDNNNNPIKTPNSFQVNTSIQRCLVKAIAIATGIGLFIYAGEDLPGFAGTEQEGPKEENDDVKAWCALCDKAAGALDVDGFRDWFKANEADIKKDCGEAGAKAVYTYFVTVGKKKAAQNG